MAAISAVLPSWSVAFDAVTFIEYLSNLIQVARVSPQHERCYVWVLYESRTVTIGPKHCFKNFRRPTRIDLNVKSSCGMAQLLNLYQVREYKLGLLQNLRIEIVVIDVFACNVSNMKNVEVRIPHVVNS